MEHLTHPKVGTLTLAVNVVLKELRLVNLRGSFSSPRLRQWVVDRIDVMKVLLSVGKSDTNPYCN